MSSKKMSKRAIVQKANWHRVRLKIDGLSIPSKTTKFKDKEWRCPIEHEEFGVVGEISFKTNGERICTTPFTEITRNIARRDPQNAMNKRFV